MNCCAAYVYVVYCTVAVKEIHLAQERERCRLL
jgi:hypothetical protein